MKVKPKEVMVNVPAVHLFNHEGEDAVLAAAFNTFINGKVHLKYETLGTLGGQYVAIFYLQRNNEFSELRQQFKELIEQEEMEPKDMGQPPMYRSHPVDCECEMCQWPV